MDLSQPANGTAGRSTSTLHSMGPFRTTGLFDLENSPPASRNTSGLNSSASPFHSLQNLDTAKPFFEPDYPSQRFRPEVYEEEDPNDPYYSPPPTFVPPESPNSIEGENSSGEPSAESRTVRSSSSKDYTGVTLIPGQLSNLSTYGIFGPPASLTSTNSTATKQPGHTEGDKFVAKSLAGLDTAGGALNVSGILNSPVQNTMPHYSRYQPPRVDESPFSSESEIHPGGGVPLYGSEDTVSSTQHQTHTFAQLAAEQGIREWNNGVFDDRWLLQPEEMWKTAARRNSALTVSPDRQPLERNNSRTVIPITQPTEASHELAAKQKQIDALNRELEELRHKFRGASMSSEPGVAHGGEEHRNAIPNIYGRSDRFIERQNELIPVPLEIERLENCVQDLQTGKATLPSGLPHSAEAIREYFWNRVFPGVGQPNRLRWEEASRLTKVAGSNITLKAVRQQVLNDIEDLVTYLVSPNGEGARENSIAHVTVTQDNASQPFDPLPELSPQVVGTSKGQAFNDQLDSVGGRDRNRSRVPSRGEDRFSMGLPIDQRRNVKSQSTVDEALSLGKARLGRLRIPEYDDTLDDSPTPRPHTVSEHALGVGLGQESTMLSSKSHMPHEASKVTQAAPGPFAYGVPPQHLTLGEYPLPMYAAPAYGAQVNPGSNPWAVQQGPYGGYQSMPYANPWQQAYGQPPSAYGQLPSAYGQPPMTAYMPPPMPNTFTHARPAATNRVARLFSHSNAFLNPETMQARPQSQNAEWQNRFIMQPAVVPDVPILPYRVGSDDMYPVPTGTASVHYQNLTRDDPPSIQLASAEESVPFAENARLMKPPQWGVMKIGNIPYDLTKAQILNFLGPHAKIITTDLGPPIHIIMDRSTGKTMDCYVEFFSTPDARACANSLGLRPHGQNRIGDRVVDIHLSSQEDLLKELFPKAKNISWEGGRPKVMETKEMFNSGFKTFVSAEELGCLVRHAEQPHRSNYTQRSPQRTYESLISLLGKFPWYDVSHYTLATRNLIFQATRTMLHILSINLRKAYTTPTSASPLSMFGSPSKHSHSASFGGTPLLTEQLLKELLMAGLNAPGFSEKQRWELFQMSEYARHHFRLSPLLQYWPWEGLSRKARMDEDVVEFYANLVANNPVTEATGFPFGSLDHLVRNIDFEANTMDNIGEMESKMFYALIPGGITGEIGDEMEKVVNAMR